MLTVTDHSRASAGLRYVYPVLSRRSGGLSIGINLNTNSACNWACLYCQVPGLSRGKAPTVDLALLRRELSQFIADLEGGDFYERFQVPEAQRVIQDIAISGNGEPTSAGDFAEVVDVIGDVCRRFELLGRIKLVLITNGSLIGQAKVRDGLSRWRRLGGEMWFKLDHGTPEGRLAINGVNLSDQHLLSGLQTATELCPTWIQTCLFSLDSRPPSRSHRDAYLGLLAEVLGRGAVLQGVLLYGLARPSVQPGASRLARLGEHELETFAEDIRKLGLEVRVTP